MQTLDEHTIKAPFDGIITKRMKNPGESVRANEAVVELGNLNRLAADCYVPIEYAYRVKEGQAVEIQPRSKSRTPLPVEKKRFRGKITFVDPEIQPIGETAVRIRAEFENPGWELRPGLEGQMTIFLPAEAAAANPPDGPDGGPGRRDGPISRGQEHPPAEGTITSMIPGFDPARWRPERTESDHRMPASGPRATRPDRSHATPEGP